MTRRRETAIVAAELAAELAEVRLRRRGGAVRDTPPQTLREPPSPQLDHT